MSETHTYHVRGMTCGHCARAVATELEALDAVTGVTVDVVPEGDSAVPVTSTADLTHDEVRDAVERAGYELVGTASG